MTASVSDKITDTRNAARPNSTTVTSSRSSGGTTLACSNLAGWPTASKVHFVTYSINSSSVPIAGTQLDCYGIVSGNSINSFTIVDGTDTGNSIGDVVEMLPTAAWGQDLADGLGVAHNRDGSHKTGATYPAAQLTASPTITTPTIASFVNATHTHANAAGGGQLPFGALASTIFSGQVQTQVNAGSAGGNMWWINLGGIKILWGESASLTSSTGGLGYVFALPSFFTTVQTAICSLTTVATDARQYASGDDISITQFGFNLMNTPGGSPTGTVGVLIIGT